MQAVTYPVQLPPGAETHTSRGDEKTGLKEMKADKMETTESWWEDEFGQNLWNSLSGCWSGGFYFSLFRLPFNATGQFKGCGLFCVIFFGLFGLFWRLTSWLIDGMRHWLWYCRNRYWSPGHVYKSSPFVLLCVATCLFLGWTTVEQDSVWLENVLMVFWNLNTH